MAKARESASPTEIAKFQRWEWTVRRAGWLVLSALLAAAAAGLFGRGPLARTHVAAPGGWRVDYERFARNQTPTRLTVTLPVSPERPDTVALWLDREYGERAELRPIQPEPLMVAAASDRLVYRFVTLAGKEPLRIAFDVEPQKAGRLRARLGVMGADSVSFTQLVYP